MKLRRHSGAGGIRNYARLHGTSGSREAPAHGGGEQQAAQPKQGETPRLRRIIDRVERIPVFPGQDIVVAPVCPRAGSEPDIDIFTFFKLREAARDVPVVVMSALEDDETAILAVREGAQDYLFKGIVNPAVLIRSIRHSIERKRNRDELRQTREDLEVLLEKKDAEIADLKKRLDAALKNKK